MTNYLKNLPFFFYFFLLTEKNLIGSVPNAGPISREMAVVGTGLVVRAAPAFLSPAIHGSEDADDGIGSVRGKGTSNGRSTVKRTDANHGPMGEGITVPISWRGDTK